MRNGILILLISSLAACSTEEVTYQSALETKSQFFLNREEDARARLLQEIRQTRDTIDVAAQSMTDVELANAIITAAKAGARVRIVGDEAAKSDDGFSLLDDYRSEILFDDDDNNDSTFSVVYGNGELRYLPDPTLSPLLDNCGYATIGDKITCPSANPLRPLSNRLMVRPDEYNVMSHNFIILGDRVVWNFASPFDDASTIPLAWRLDGEMVRESFWREFNQMHAGVFATTLSIYNGPIKSGGQWSPIYITEFGEFHMRFGPQERVIKTLIDDAYKSRANVWIMTNDLSEPFLLDALDYKKRNNFDVRVIVNRDEQNDELVGRLIDLDARYAPASLDYVPTMVVVDSEPNRLGEVEKRRIHVISHPVWKTGAFQTFPSTPNDYVEIYKSDYFTDGLMWSVVAYPGQENVILDQMKRLWETTWAASTEVEL